MLDTEFGTKEERWNYLFPIVKELTVSRVDKNEKMTAKTMKKIVLKFKGGVEKAHKSVWKYHAMP